MTAAPVRAGCRRRSIGGTCNSLSARVREPPGRLPDGSNRHRAGRPGPAGGRRRRAGDRVPRAGPGGRRRHRPCPAARKPGRAARQPGRRCTRRRRGRSRRSTHVGHRVVPGRDPRPALDRSRLHDRRSADDGQRRVLRRPGRRHGRRVAQRLVPPPPTADRRAGADPGGADRVRSAGRRPPGLPRRHGHAPKPSVSTTSAIWPTPRSPPPSTPTATVGPT